MNKKKKSTNISPYPDEAIDRLARAFHPAILACMEQRGRPAVTCRGEAPPSAVARPFGRSKAPLGLLLLRKRELALAGRTGSSYPRQKNRAFPTGNALLYISLSSVVFCRVRPIRGRALFFYYDSSFSTRSIRYPTPTWVWIRCGASGQRSNFLRRDAM